MSIEESIVQLEQKDGVAILRLNEPARRNPLSRRLKSEIASNFTTLLKIPEIRAIILTGTGSAFCAGGDIADMEDRSTTAVRHRLTETHRWARQILCSPKPTIAAVNGPAAGAGFGLALLCDIMIAADTATFRASFPSIGASPDMALAYTLPRSVGTTRAREVLLLNKVLDAQCALECGMANEVVPAGELMSRAMEVASKLAAGPTLAFELAKGLLNEAYGPIDCFLNSEANAQAVAFGTSDFNEGVTAFQQRRKSSFNGY